MILGPWENSGGIIFMILIFANITIAFFSILVGGAILYFSSMDLEELKDLSFLQKILGVITKLSPLIIKLAHIIKAGLFLGLTYFVIAPAKMFKKPGSMINYTDHQWFQAINLTHDCRNLTWANETLGNYNSYIKYFYGFDLIILFMTFFLLGFLKNIVEHPAFVYIPLSNDSGTFTKYCCHYLGP